MPFSAFLFVSLPRLAILGALAMFAAVLLTVPA